MTQTSVIRIDLSALGHNTRVLRRIVGPSCALCPLVKADAYGFGAVPIARHLAACGADMLAVYTAAQAVELAAASIPCPILVLMSVRDLRTLRDLAPGLAERRFHLTVHDPGQLEALRLGARRLGVEIPVHLELDTGMSRGGCTIEVFPRLLRRIGECTALRLAGVFTHFANAERDVAATDRQMDQLDRLLARDAALVPPDCLIHAANSSATLRDRRYHKSLVRVGLAWAGYVNERLNGSAIHGAHDLRPILTWQSSIVGVKSIAAGTPVGYGSTWTATRRTRIGLVPVGYADGYPIGVGAGAARSKPARVGVIVGDGDRAQPQYAPVIGSVNMDQITIDLTDCTADDAAGPQIGIGTTVELISPEPSAPNYLFELARTAGTIPHELLCRLNPRIRRAYEMGVAGPGSVVPVARIIESLPAFGRSPQAGEEGESATALRDASAGQAAETIKTS